MAAPIGKGTPVLPAEAYTSQDWFDREQELIFSRTWAFAGLEEDLGEPGQFITVQAGLNNLFVVMGHDGHARAFHNMCRHRGTQLLRSTGKSRKVITCPYHDWTYDLEGKLLAVPDEKREFAGIDKSCLGLHRASVAVWRGMIFVHPDPDAAPLNDWFGAVEPYLGPHKPELLVEDPESAVRHTVNANWKIVVENYIDAYHLSHLHSGTLGMYDHAKIESRFVGPHFAFYEPLAKHYAADVDKNAPVPLIDHIPREKLGAYVPMLFPGLGLGEDECSWSVFHVIPVSPEKSIVATRTKMMDVSAWEYTKQEWRSGSFWEKHVRPKFEGSAENDPLATSDFLTEDIFVCEQQQKSLKSPYFSVGASAERGEAPVREFQRLVNEWLGAASA